MKKFLNNRVLPIVCTLSILVSAVVVPASAEWVSDRDVRDDDSIEHWEALLVPISDLELYIKFASNFGEFSGTATVKDVFWNLVNRVVLSHEVGEVGIDDLEILCAQYNNYFNRELAESFGEQLFSGTQELMNDILATVFFGKPSLTFEIRSWDTSGMQRIYCPELDAWVVSSNGRYAYANEAYLDTSGGNQWIGETTANDRVKSGVVNMQDLDRLNLMAVKLKEDGLAVQLKTLNGADGKSKYYGIWYNRQFYADESGNPFVAPYSTNEWASNQSRPDTSVKDENGETVEGLPEENTTGIDLSGMTITLPDGSINFIDKIIYDESTKSYHIDSHDTYNYEFNFYYEWNYYINYTSITYIGQTEEYNKYYEVYYELPDGRDSADLTKEEVEQLNVSVDVIPYGRSADDTSLRSLYHFDGDTRDSSYWNYCTDFTWNKGASLTYMDAGVFDGALYLDETEHDFTLTLPSNIGSGDFTLQFRYYQSATAAAQTDSYVMLGDFNVFQFDGSNFKNGSGSSLASTPIGTWNEIALIRDNSVLYYYLNGVCIGQFSTSVFYNDKITFHFGSGQQTFKYFDELRVLNYALQTGGANYEPTSVPHDTNLALVLPDSAVPVADEYWDIESSGLNLVSSDFVSSPFPEDYTRVEYIESTGTQYIDTGFVPDQDTKLIMKVMALTIANASSSGGFIPYGSSESSEDGAFETYSWNGHQDVNYDGQRASLDTAIQDDVCVITHDKNEFSLISSSGTSMSYTFTYNEFTCPRTLILFGTHRASPLLGKQRIYSCQIYDNGTLIRDYVPCVDSSGAAGLYDTVNDAFYINAGTGTFTVGATVSASAGSNVQEHTFAFNRRFNYDSTPLDVFYHDSAYTLVSLGRECLIVESINDDAYFSESPQEDWARGLLINCGWSKYPALSDGKYTLSVVLSDGTISSFSFTSNQTSSTSKSFDWGTLGYYVGNYQYDDYDCYTAYIDPYSGGNAIEIVYIELVQGSSTDLTVEKISSVTGIDTENMNTPTLAVRTDLDITSYQIGGVRPSLPTKGQVWALVENERITSIQIYNGQAWESCDGRIWTGERWIPASSYNIVTLQDMYDIVDATTDYEYIYTESGFWAWWQKSWNAFTEKLFSLLGSGSSSDGSSATTQTFWGKIKDAIANGLSSLIETLFELIETVLKSLIGAAIDLLSGIFGFFTDTVLGGISDFFNSLGELVNPFESTVENEDGTTTTTTELPEGIAAVFAFFSGAFLVMPAELRMIAMFGIGLMLLLAVFKKVSA